MGWSFDSKCPKIIMKKNTKPILHVVFMFILALLIICLWHETAVTARIAVPTPCAADYARGPKMEQCIRPHALNARR
jgi:hypothetical protein